MASEGAIRNEAMAQQRVFDTQQAVSRLGGGLGYSIERERAKQAAGYAQTDLRAAQAQIVHEGLRIGL